MRVGKMSYGLNKTLKMCTVKVDLATNLPKSESKSSKNGLSPDWRTTSLTYYKSAVNAVRK